LGKIGLFFPGWVLEGGPWIYSLGGHWGIFGGSGLGKPELGWHSPGVNLPPALGKPGDGGFPPEFLWGVWAQTGQGSRFQKPLLGPHLGGKFPRNLGVGKGWGNRAAG